MSRRVRRKSPYADKIADWHRRVKLVLPIMGISLSEDLNTHIAMLLMDLLKEGIEDPVIILDRVAAFVRRYRNLHGEL